MARSGGHNSPPLEDDTAGAGAEARSVEPGEGIAADMVAPDWLSLAQNAYEDSTRYLESNYRDQWDKNERSFQGKHPSGSKYSSAAYKHRSKVFRPKTRAAIRGAEADFAQSLFANEESVSVRAQNQSSELGRAAADFHRELLNYRLGSPDPKIGVNWFMTAIGACQDAQRYGVVCSEQCWHYEEVEESVEVAVMDGNGEPVLDEETGEPVTETETRTRIVKDKPVVRLIPPENLRIDRAANWLDPINSSPFVIELMPMYLADVQARMEAPNRKTGQPPWKKYDASQLRSARTQDYDSTRQRRTDREDPLESGDKSISEFDTVWVHRNIIRWKGRDWIYYTAGVEFMLSDPVPLEQEYFHGIRPYVMGIAIIETHKIYPSGKPQLTEGLQILANEIANQRIDNVRLAMNKRYFTKRGRNVDLLSLVRNAPGSVTQMDDPSEDVKVIETKDVTGSAYAEQDRINLDYDEIAGSFSASSVQSNRRMNETVGGMQILAGGANKMGEYDMRVLVETWVEPVLRHLVLLNQAYETDETILALAGANAKTWETYSVSPLSLELMDQDLLVRVNVGIGATDPMQRINKFKIGIDTVSAALGPQILSALDGKEVVKEVFGALGYRDGMRFYKFGDQDPTVMMLMEEVERLQQMIEGKQVEGETKITVAETLAKSRISQQIEENKGHFEQEMLKGRNALILEGARGRMNGSAEHRA